MVRRVSLIVLAMVFAITLTSTAALAAGDKKGKRYAYGHKRIKKAKKCERQPQCELDQDLMTETVREAVLDALYESNINKPVECPVCSEPKIMTPVEDPVVAESRQFALQKCAEDHPNHPGAAGVYINFFINDTDTIQKILNTSGGEYEVLIQVRTPEGEEISTKTTLFAEEVDKAYRDHYVQLIK